MASDDEGAKGQEFVVAHRFMWRDYGLSGVTLLVYARIYGFCRDSYESKTTTADFLGTTPRSFLQAKSAKWRRWKSAEFTAWRSAQSLAYSIF